MPKLTVSSEDPTEIFTVLQKLGEGSYGSVFKALDARDNSIVAIKVLEAEGDEDTAELQKEIDILKECNSEYVVAYKGTYQEDGNIWIVMEYCGAGSLCDLMAICERVLDEEQIATVMKMSLHGLEYLHKRRKIHRDIKSGNILLNHDGDCKLADFGVSAQLTDTMAKRKTMIGTPYWMAPEVLQSTEYDGKADIWSLAITAIELATSEPPHSNVHPMRAIFLIPNSEPPTLPDPECWSEDFKDFLQVCLVKEAKNRPTATELLANHPFITKARGKNIIAELVSECMQQIDEYREAGEDEGDEDDESDDGTMMAGDYSTVAYSGTMVDSGTMACNSETMAYSGTMVDSGTMAFNSDTMVNSGTMVANPNQTRVRGDSNYRAAMGHAKKSSQSTNPAVSSSNPTTSSNPTSPSTPALATASPPTSTNISAALAATSLAESKTVQSHFGAARKNKDRRKSLKTMRPSGLHVTSGPVPPELQFYALKKEVDLGSQLTVPELRKVLADVSKGYELEKDALESYYSAKRKQIQATIAARQRSTSATMR